MRGFIFLFLLFSVPLRGQVMLSDSSMVFSYEQAKIMAIELSRGRLYRDAYYKEYELRLVMGEQLERYGYLVSRQDSVIRYYSKMVGVQADELDLCDMELRQERRRGVIYRLVGVLAVILALVAK